MNIQGYLKICVLQTLSESPMSGYGLMGRLRDVLGKRPSPGSIYPLLHTLEERGYILVKEEERRKLYQLTKSGKDLLTQFLKEKEQFATTATKMHTFFANLGEDKHANNLCREFMENMDTGRLPYKDLQIVLDECRAILGKKLLEEKVSQEKIIKVIKNLKRQLEGLR